MTTTYTNSRKSISITWLQNQRRWLLTAGQVSTQIEPFVAAQFLKHSTWDKHVERVVTLPSSMAA